MKIKKELLISGNITEEEIQELQNELSDQDFTINKLITKSYTVSEFLQILFSDLNVISFTRDFILGGLLTASWIQIKKVIKKLEKRKKKVKTISYDIEVKSKKNMTYILNFVSQQEKFEILIELAEKKINLEFINELNDERRIYISIDSENRLIIERF